MNTEDIKRMARAYQAVREGSELVESHFKVGDKVEYTAPDGGEYYGEVVKLDEPQKGAYYNVKLKNGKMVKATSDQLEAEDDDEEDEEDDMKEAMDPVNHKALKGTFKDRADKDIDNDGDTDKSDEYLHKRRKAVSKSVKGETATMNPKIDSGKSTSSEQKEETVTEDYGAMKDAEDHASKNGEDYKRDTSVQHRYDAYHMKKAGYTHFEPQSHGNRRYTKGATAHPSSTKIGPEHHKGVSESVEEKFNFKVSHAGKHVYVKAPNVGAAMKKAQKGYGNMDLTKAKVKNLGKIGMPANEAVNTADKKPEEYMGADGKMHIRMVPTKKDIVKKESTIRDRLMSVLEKKDDHYKSATSPEPIDSKDSPNAKKMRKDHKPEVMADINKVSDDVAKAAAATKVSPKNPTDKGAKGDMKVINPAQDVTKQGGFKESVTNIWNAYKSVVEKK